MGELSLVVNILLIKKKKHFNATYHMQAQSSVLNMLNSFNLHMDLMA